MNRSKRKKKIIRKLIQIKRIKKMHNETDLKTKIHRKGNKIKFTRIKIFKTILNMTFLNL